jgi:pimeloyl-ACP methyl ester carboxylesterase
LLLHGFLDLGYGWFEVGEQLAKHGHVIAPDLRGHGDSDWVGAGGYYHFFDYLADVDSLVTRLARKRLVVVGHSMGGSVAAYWAGTRPERVSSLALLEGLGPADQPETGLPNRTAMWIDAWKTAREKGKAMPSLEDAAKRLRKHDPLLREDLALRLAEAGTRAVDGGGFAWKHDPLHLTMGPYPYRREYAEQYWRRVTCPVLIVDGEKSTFNLPNAERELRRNMFANHRYVTLPDAAHMMQRHQPAALTERLIELSR